MGFRPAGEGRLAWIALLACLACSTTRFSSVPVPEATGAPAPISPEAGLERLQHERLDPAEVRVQPEGITVGASFMLDLYTLFHRRGYRAFRLAYEGAAGNNAVAHLLLPDGDGPHPLVMVFPILGGSHTVSEALAKAMANRGYAALRIERRELPLETSSDPALLADALRSAVLDARRILDWAEAHPKLDPQRFAAAGVSLGSMQALLLCAADPRVRGGFFALTGGGLAEILYDSRERPVRVFRDRLIEERGLDTRDAFLTDLRQHTLAVDPLSYADRIEPASALIASGRWDRVVPPERAEALWHALHQPTWIHLPSGHYQFFPFFWWVAGRGATHLDELFAPLPGASRQAKDVIPITDRQLNLHDGPSASSSGRDH